MSNLRGLRAYLTRRVLGYLVVAATIALLSFAGIGRADAQTVPAYTCGGTGACNQQEAYTECKAWAEYSVAVYSSTFGWTCEVFLPDNVPRKYQCLRKTNATGGATGCLQHELFVFGACPPPTVWNDSLKQCFDPSECLDRNSELGTGGLSPRVSAVTSKCVAGCTFKMESGFQTDTVQAMGGPVTFYRGVMQYDGNVCSTLPMADEQEPKSPPKQECTQAGAGQTFCVKPNGDHCHTASTGRQICWGTGETGEKTDGDSKQKRDAGPNPIAPNLNLPNGDTLQPKGDPITSVTNTSTTNITTTTTTYNTVNGTNTGTPSTPGTPGSDSGEPADGSGGGGTGSGSGNGDEPGSASGGGNCDPASQPVVTGDPLLAMITLQTWATRCAVESKDAVTSTGDIASCASPFTVTGPPKSAELLKLKAIRKTICPAEGEGTTNVDQYGDNEASAWFTAESMGVVTDGEPTGTEGLDTSGFGFGTTCPTIPDVAVMGQTIHFDTSIFCDWMHLGGYLVLTMAALVGVRILGAA